MMFREVITLVHSVRLLGRCCCPLNSDCSANPGAVLGTSTLSCIFISRNTPRAHYSFSGQARLASKSHLYVQQWPLEKAMQPTAVSLPGDVPKPEEPGGLRSMWSQESSATATKPPAPTSTPRFYPNRWIASE